MTDLRIAVATWVTLLVVFGGITAWQGETRPHMYGSMVTFTTLLVLIGWALVAVWRWAL